MLITCNDNTVFIEDLNDFSISETLECGQCFRFEKITDNHYIIIAHKKLLHIEQSETSFKFYPTNLEEFEKIWSYYFDLNNDYSKIKAELSKDNIVKKAISFAPGIRILNQEPLECLISFIFSQNKSIPMIKQTIKNLCELCGESVINQDVNNVSYSFPDINKLITLTEADFLKCKAGFRAKYALDAVKKVYNNEVCLNSTAKRTYDELKTELLKIHGVGNKIADCVILFSLGNRQAFPIDVWIYRIMCGLYFNNQEVPKQKIEALASEKFGNLGGYAQQYLFHYARINKSFT